ncbi:MAG: T9SS type A sorting domain-containing protein, partial [Candidatus Eisenbacteria sp.]|nr:T9SS type A sorting domain-containing protein [Candidatus Eisenbacteria bacterium]
GKGAATGITGILRTSTAGVTVTDSVADFQDIGPESTGSTLAPHFEISIDGGFSDGDWIDLELAVSTDTRAATVHFPVYVGDFDMVFVDDFETDLGWTVGAPDDDATEGIWERVVTTEKLSGRYTGDTAQPGKDATVHPGTMCFVTENSPLGTKQRFGDVDGGKTTLISPVFDLSNCDKAVLTYERWYSNNTIPTQTDDDPFDVDVSDDGGATWTNLENLTETPEDREFHQVIFELSGEVSLTNQMQIRFVAQDYGLNSVVEAVVDNIEIRGYGGFTDVALGEPIGRVSPARAVLDQNIPNPFNPETTISFGLPEASRVDLSIYNIRGQRVRQLVDGWMPAGFHKAAWDGRDVNGQQVSSGVYFYRLTTPEDALTRRMTLIK